MRFLQHKEASTKLARRRTLVRPEDVYCCVLNFFGIISLVWMFHNVFSLAYARSALQSAACVKCTTRSTFFVLLLRFSDWLVHSTCLRPAVCHLHKPFATVAIVERFERKSVYMRKNEHSDCVTFALRF
jgi:hypothetical protein